MYMIHIFIHNDFAVIFISIFYHIYYIIQYVHIYYNIQSKSMCVGIAVRMGLTVRRGCGTDFG